MNLPAPLAPARSPLCEERSDKAILAGTARRPALTTSIFIAALVAMLAGGALMQPSAQAAESAAVTSERAAVSLVSETSAYQPGEPFRLGLHFRLAPGWHIYWQNPGDAGSPPEIAWSLPPAADATAIAWPAPVRDADGSVTSFVYTGDFVLPVRITPPPGGLPLDIGAEASWLVCQNICVPEEGRFHLTLSPGTPAPGTAAPLFAAADARQPQPNPFAASTAPDGSLRVTGRGLSRTTVQDAWFFPSAGGDIDQNAPQPVAIQDGAVTLKLVPGAQFSASRGLDGVLVLRDPKGGESYLSLHAPGGAAVPPPPATIGLARALLFAVLGGLLLNLMPCVFPVLAMKALAIARLSGEARHAVRRQALSYAAGVLVAFTTFGALLLAARAAGSAAGWGFQFQSPLFVAAIAWLLFAVGLNLSGLYEVGGRFTGAGQSLAGRGGHLGSFAAGLLAVVVATPCTAPFMSGAIAAAAVASNGQALSVFLALGLGLALPYLLLAAIPHLARLLPRPGPWMAVLREALAFPMYGAAIWLLWVASEQSGPIGTLVVAGGMGLLGLAGWLLRQAQRSSGWPRVTSHALASVAAAGALALLPALAAVAPGPAQAATDGSEPFSAVRLAALRAANRPVFVDMTAAWCVTCLVNERVALDASDVRRAFAAQDVAYLKGDWTRQDPQITGYLRAAGHDGVPLYVFYPPGGEGRILPQILTPGVVLANLQP